MSPAPTMVKPEKFVADFEAWHADQMRQPLVKRSVIRDVISTVRDYCRVRDEIRACAEREAA